MGFWWAAALLAVPGLAAHAAATLWLHRGLRRVLPRTAATPPISVVVAAHNERRSVAALVRAVLTQDYPGALELLLVDDRSGDGTAEVAEAVLAELAVDAAGEAEGTAGSGPGGGERRARVLRMLRVPPGVAPKKYALQQGLEAARHTVIALTDADALPPPSWLRTQAAFLAADVGLVIGPAPLRGTGLVGRAAALEALALGTVAAGSAGLGYAVTCSGRNLLYRRQALASIGEFRAFYGLGAGDDDLLLGRLRDGDQWRIRHPWSAAGAVPSPAVDGWREWLAQKRRHAANSLRFSLPIVAAALPLFLYLTAPLWLLLLGIGTSRPLPGLGAAGLLWLLRALLDRHLLRPTSAAFTTPLPPLPSLLASEILFTFMVFLVVPLGILFGYTWKGTRYRGGRSPADGDNGSPAPSAARSKRP
jgi:cellulose synthase/poly-beta-1,6-N-acetylglucosamine synthase-like glycosyltransferase